MWGGLEGLGISYLLGFFFYLLQVFVIVHKKYSFSFLKTFGKISGIQFLLGLSCFMISRFVDSPYLYIAGSVIIMISAYYSYRELDRRLGLKALLNEKFRKKERK
jgi:hypothetical protein